MLNAMASGGTKGARLWAAAAESASPRSAAGAGCRMALSAGTLLKDSAPGLDGGDREAWEDVSNRLPLAWLELSVSGMGGMNAAASSNNPTPVRVPSE